MPLSTRKAAPLVAEDVRRYQSRTIEAAQVIAELINLAKQMRDAPCPKLYQHFF
jgi:hypothetical protein